MTARGQVSDASMRMSGSAQQRRSWKQQSLFDVYMCEFTCVCASLSVCPAGCLFAVPTLYLSVCLSVCLSVYTCLCVFV